MTENTDILTVPAEVALRVLGLEGRPLTVRAGTLRGMLKAALLRKGWTAGGIPEMADMLLHTIRTMQA